MNIGKFCRQTRENLQLSMSTIAEAAGISIVYYSDIERGRRDMPLNDKFEKIMETLQIPKTEWVILKETALAERGKVVLDIDNSEKGILAKYLGARWDTLSKKQISKISEILLSKNETR